MVLGMELSNCHMKSWKVARSKGNVEGGAVISCCSFGAEVGRVIALELSASGDFIRSKGVLGELHNVSRSHCQMVNSYNQVRWTRSDTVLMFRMTRENMIKHTVCVGKGDLHRSALLTFVTPATSLFGFPCERFVLVSEHQIKLVRISRTCASAFLALATYWALLVALCFD